MKTCACKHVHSKHIYASAVFESPDRSFITGERRAPCKFAEGCPDTGLIHLSACGHAPHIFFTSMQGSNFFFVGEKCFG